MNKDTGAIGEVLKTVSKKVVRYRALLFFIFVAAIYGFIIYRINVLSNASPDDSTVAQASQAPKQPHIDKSVVQKIQDLQDNSVNVQSLFNQARQNPFQE